MTKFEKFLADELGIEFKAAMYFYTMFFFYFVYQLSRGNWQADLWVLLQMIATTYVMGYIQVFLLGNFDEAERVTWQVVAKVICGALVYTCISYIGKWFDRNLTVTLIYFAFMIGCYGCAYWVYSFKRSVSTKEMNEELNMFKEQKKSKMVSLEQ